MADETFDEKLLYTFFKRSNAVELSQELTEEIRKINRDAKESGLNVGLMLTLEIDLVNTDWEGPGTDEHFEIEDPGPPPTH